MVTGPGRRALLFLDVDGPLLPFGTTAPAFATARPPHPPLPGPARPGPPLPGGDNPLLARLDPALGPRLAALPCDLVWATTWSQEANECLAPRLGLPRLPVVLDWDEPSPQDRWFGLHWKTRTLVARAEGRPFAWVDDEITDADRTWVSQHHQAPALLHHVDPRRGLTAPDFTTLATWLRTATAPPQCG